MAIKDVTAGAEESKININKPYKKRRLKPARRAARMQYKQKMKKPNIKRKAQIKRKVYRRKNKQVIKRRSGVVKRMKKNLPPSMRASLESVLARLNNYED